MDTPKNSKPEYSGVCIHIVGIIDMQARGDMTYQNRIILDCITKQVRRRGLSIVDKDQLTMMVVRNIGRLNSGDNVAVEIDSLGVVLSVRKISGFDCLHDVDEAAIIISFHELEGAFYDQQTVSF